MKNWKCVDCGYEDDERSLICPNCATGGELGTEMQSHGMHLSPVTMQCIEAEYTRAHIKHAGHTPKNPRMSDGERLAILVEEIGEVARAMTYDNGSLENLRDELIQVAAMAGAHAEYVMVRIDSVRNGLPDPGKENAVSVHKEFGPDYRG